MCAQGAFPPRGNAPRAHNSACLMAGGTSSAGERLLGLQARDGVEVAEDPGELLGGPRLAAVAAPVAEGGEAQRAAGLVLLDREVPCGRGPVAGAALRAQPQAPAGDDDRAAVGAALPPREHGRLTTPGHGALPSTVPPGRAEPCAWNYDGTARDIGTNGSYLNPVTKTSSISWRSCVASVQYRE